METKRNQNDGKKGQSKELSCRKMHEAEGWKCVFKSQRVKFGRIDFAMGVADLVFVRGKTKKFVSVKSHSHYQTHPQHREFIKKYKDEHGLPDESFWLYIWKEGRWEGGKNNKVWIPPCWVIIEI